MTDNRTTELLREGLTERGVEYQAIGKRLTYWNRDGSKNDCDDADFVADEQNGYLIVEGLTPEQAIAATLGSGTCNLKDTTSPTNDDYWNSAMCSECGAEFTCAIFGADMNAPDAFYCPNCGRKVVSA